MDHSTKKIEYRVPVKTQIIRGLLRPVFRVIFRFLSRIEITGRENVPTSGAYLIAINHVSIYDPPFLLAFWPVAPEAAGAIEIWERPGQNFLARLYRGIPVHRGSYDRELIEKLVKVLKSGRPLLIAPEGGRTHQPGLRKGLPGVAYLADKAEVPVIPVGIYGATDDFLSRALRFQRPILEMNIGKAFKLPRILGTGEARRAARQANSDLIMQHIAMLLPIDYQGLYRINASLQT